jgi:hypothetical protein
MSSEFYAQMDEVLANDVVNRHSLFQLKYFVVGKEPTHQSKLWRCIRELQARRESIQAVSVELENVQDELELCDIQLLRLRGKQAVIEDDLDARELVVLLRREERRRESVVRSIDTLRKKLKDAEEEAVFFLKSFQSLEQLEPLQPFDDVESQQSYWNAKFAEELNLRSLMGQPISYELIKSILSLNNDAPIKMQIVNTLENKQKQMLKILKEEKNDRHPDIESRSAE